MATATAAATAAAAAATTAVFERHGHARVIAVRNATVGNRPTRMDAARSFARDATGGGMGLQQSSVQPVSVLRLTATNKAQNKIKLPRGVDAPAQAQYPTKYGLPVLVKTQRQS